MHSSPLAQAPVWQRPPQPSDAPHSPWAQLGWQPVPLVELAAPLVFPAVVPVAVLPVETPLALDSAPVLELAVVLDATPVELAWPVVGALVVPEVFAVPVTAALVAVACPVEPLPHMQAA
jgi:hypothetical protein